MEDWENTDIKQEGEFVIVTTELTLEGMFEPVETETPPVTTSTPEPVEPETPITTEPTSSGLILFLII